MITYAITLGLLASGALSKTPLCGLVPGAEWACDPSPPSNEWPAAANVLNIKEPPFNAKGDGIHDDTFAIQQAVLNSTLMQVIYFPTGTYVTKEPIVCKNWHAELAKGIVLQGESQEGSIIRLADQSPAFQDDTEKNITGMFIFGNAPAQNFANLVESLTISTGSRNPGAAALQFNANNEGGVFNVTLISEDSTAAVGLDLGFCSEIGPTMIQYLGVKGCRVGVRVTKGPDSVTMEHIAVYNASIAGILHSQQDIFARDFSIAQEVSGAPGVLMLEDNHHGTQLTIVDSTFTYMPAVRGQGGVDGTSSSAAGLFSNSSAVFARNLVTKGFNASIDDAGTYPVPGDTVLEYSSNGVAKPFSDSPNSSLGLPTRETPWVDLPRPSAASPWVSLVGSVPLYAQGSCPKPWMRARTRKQVAAEDAAVRVALQALGISEPASGGIGGEGVRTTSSLDPEILFDGRCSPVAVWDDDAAMALPLPGLAPIVLANTSCVCGSSSGECYPEMAAAAATGARVLFAPSCGDGWPVGLHNDTAPPKIKIEDGTTHVVGAGSRIEGYVHIDSTGSSKVPLSFLRLKTSVYGHGAVQLRQLSSSRPMIVRSVQGLNFQFGDATLHSVKPSATSSFAPLFTVDTVGKPIWVPAGAEVWSRQLNIENHNTTVVVDGGRMWVLGLKTEQGNSGIANVTAGGELELLGVFSYATSGPYYDVPVMHVNESGRLSASWGSDCFRSGDDAFKVFLREERTGGEAAQVVYGDEGIFGRSGNAGFTLGRMGAQAHA